MNIPPDADQRPILTETMFGTICAAGGWPMSTNRREALTRWASFEGVPAWICNPFACTVQGIRRPWDLGIGVGPGKWNNANPPLGVGIYLNEMEGANATVAMFRQANFAPIKAWIDNGCIAPGLDGARDALVANFRLWGTTGFADLIAAGWQPSGAPAPAPAPAFSDVQVAAIKGLIDGSFGPIFLALFRQVIGLDPSTYGEPFAASVAEVRDRLTSLQVAPHVHRPGEGPTGGVLR